MKITIDGVEYHVDKLSETAQAQLRSLQFLDQQMQMIKQEIAVYETVRKTYLALPFTHKLRRPVDTGRCHSISSLKA
jgi:hypothetical protein